MAYRIAVYLIVKSSGLQDAEGSELEIVLAAKLTQAAAERMLKRNPGARIKKLIADKFAD